MREKYTDDALDLVSGLREILVPTLVFYEISNALVILTRRAVIDKEDTSRKLKSVRSIPTLNIKRPTLTRGC